MKKIDINDIKEYGKFAIILKCLLAKNKITQSELASMTGLSEATITHYVKGKTTPSQTNIDKIASALNISPRTFYGDIEEFAPYLNHRETVFAKKLSKLLKEKGLSQEQFAFEIGVARQSVNQYVNGKQLPMSDTLFKIANYFNVSIEELLDEPIEKSDEPQMQVMVSRMPTRKRKCLFIRGNYLNDIYECAFGGICVFKDGFCPKLKEVNNVTN